MPTEFTNRRPPSQVSRYSERSGSIVVLLAIRYETANLDRQNIYDRVFRVLG
jgi:hypothetical protein